MTGVTVLDLVAALPELFLAISGLGLLMLGVFLGERSFRPVAWAAVAALVVTFLLVVLVVSQEYGDGYILAFGRMMRIDAFGVFMKSLVLIGSMTALVLSLDYFEREGVARFEFPVLVVFATVGMLIMVSANDLLTLYIGLELQSLSLYVIAAIRRDNTKSTEAGLKYFVLGALSSGMLLYGASLIYGFAGTTGFDGIAQVFGAQREPAVGVIFGLVFVISGLAFKVSAVPFHMWTPDVYEGAPTPVTAFFAAAPKVAAMSLFIRVMVGPFGDMVAAWQQVLWGISVASMILGSLAAIWQTSFKRLLAYSSIGHMGYALIGLTTGTEAGITGILVYMAIYVVMSLGTFACVIAMRQRGVAVETIADLSGLARTRPGMALALAIFMFSMAGIPPLAGFFGKLYIFLAAIEAQLYWLAVIGVLTSVIGAYYYLRVIKVMYFDQPTVTIDPMSRSVATVAGIATVMILLFFVVPAQVVTWAAGAAAALFPG
jgi:NADH-quinone oxidoreductase subunit N